MENTELKSWKPIEIKEVFTDKAPKLGKWIPGFIYRYLRKIIHQDYVNQFFTKHWDKMGLDFIDAAMEEFNTKIIVEGDENIPKSGRFIFVSNHPLGGFDGLVIMKVINRYFKSFKFLVNDILMNIPNLTPLFIPINKHGRQGVEAAKELDDLLQSDTQLLSFPAGFVSRWIGGQVMDPVWHKNFISKAVKHKRDIIPIHMSGRNSKFFYRLYRFRKFIGLKANLEMLYLVDETYQHRNKTLRVKFGSPIPWQTFDKSKRPIEWAKWVKEQVYALDGVSHVPV